MRFSLLLRFALPFGVLAGLLAAPAAFAQHTAQATPGRCVDGLVGGHACSGVDLLAHVTLETMGAQSGNSLWVWVDPETGHEYALMGLDNGVAFVDVTDPANPVYVGKLPQHTASQPSSWRDVRVYDHYAFSVSEAEGHGMQVFDMNHLRSVRPADMPATFTADAHYGEVSNVHTMAVTPETGLAVLVGTNTCAAGLHFVDVRDPMNPRNLGCFSEDGYTHETQCWVYNGPDQDYQGREICLAFNEDTVTIVDATDRANPRMLARGTYPSPAYTHQGWFTDDMRYVLINDELDETQGLSPSARTIIMDLADLDAPEYIGAYQSAVPSIDHNLYIHNGKAYEANYTAGLRILDVSGVAEGRLSEVAFFDTFPENDMATFAGAWNVNPFLPSGTILVSDINGGLFILREGEQTLFGTSSFSVSPEEGAALIQFEPAMDGGPITVERRFEGRDFEAAGTVAATGPYTFHDQGLAPGNYSYRLRRTGTNGRTYTSIAQHAMIEGPPVYTVSAATANPFDGNTRISLSVTETQPVHVTLTDEAGTELRVLHDGTVQAGRQLNVEVNGASLAPGVYFVHFSGASFEGRRKLVRARGDAMGSR